MYLNDIVRCLVIVINPLMMSHDITSVLFDAYGIQCALFQKLYVGHCLIVFTLMCEIVYTSLDNCIIVCVYHPMLMYVHVCYLDIYVSVYINMPACWITYKSTAIRMYSHCLYMCCAVQSLPVHM